MKKMIATVLTMMMVFSVTACGNNAEDTRDVTDETVIEEVEESEDSDAEVTEEDAADEADAETDEETDAEEQDGVLGAVDGDVYTNAFFGIKLNVVDGYSFLDDEQIAQLGYMSAEVLGNSDITEAIESGETITDCLLADATFDNSINVTISSVDAEVSQDDAETVIDATIPYLVESFEGMGFENLACERGTTTFLGEEFPCINISFVLTQDGVSYDMSMVEVILLNDGYSATITAQAGSEDEIATLLGAFESLD